MDGSIEVPKREDPMYDAWERCNMMVLSWITKTLSPHIAERVIYVENAKILWDELKERFFKEDYFKILNLLQEIHSIRQGERNITKFFTDLKILWEELESLRPIPHYSCDIQCKCDLSKSSVKYKEIKYVIFFLKGLNDSYNHVRTQILLVEPLPNINRAFSLIIQRERQIGGNPGYNNEIKNIVNVVDKQTTWKQQDQKQDHNSRRQSE